MQKHPPYIVLSKKIGHTPLEAVTEWRKDHSEWKDVAATYAGRLDPMASGKLLVLLGEECKNAKNYTELDKEYEIEVVFEIGTDTGDALGLPSVSPTRRSIIMSTLEQVFDRVLGSHSVPYPAFSSKTVNGIPLFQYALEGKLSSISIPEHIETIHSIRVAQFSQISGKALLQRIQQQLQHVPHSDESSKELGADFRQDDIRKAWDTALKPLAEKQFTILTIRVACASGTYMRTLAERLATSFGTRGFALSIHRSKIGTLKKVGPFTYWSHTY
jgi:tRNA U55 pseudouridine synthase TruB